MTELHEDRESDVREAVITAIGSARAGQDS